MGHPAIEKAIKFYGKEGEKNGVSVTFADLSKRGAAAETHTTSLFGLFKSTTITFDLKAMDRGEGVADDGGVAVHEGTHGVDGKEGITGGGSRAAYFRLEYRAWQAGTAVGKGLDTLQTLGGVWRGGGDANNRDVAARIMTNAQENADHDCEVNGDCK